MAKDKYEKDYADARNAVATLIRLGRQSFTNPDEASTESALAHGLMRGLAGGFEPLDPLLIAGDLLEDVNSHTYAAIVRAMYNDEVRKLGENRYEIRTNLPPNWQDHITIEG